MVETRQKRKRREDSATWEDEARPRRARREDEGTAGTFYCGICLETHFRIEGMRLGSCSDMYCRDSLVSYLRSIRSLPISCPSPGCALHFNVDNVLNLLIQYDDTKTHDFIANLNAAAVVNNNRHNNKKCCSSVGCEEAVSEAGKPCCKRCQALYCGTCGLEKHDEDIGKCPLEVLAKEKKWKACPSCNYLIERSGGCNAVKCRCGVDFCYNCGTKYRANSGRRGGVTAGCNCGQFENVPRLRLRSFDLAEITSRLDNIISSRGNGPGPIPTLTPGPLRLPPQRSILEMIQQARELTTDGSFHEARSALERGTRLLQIQTNHMRTLFASINQSLDASATDISNL